MFFDQLKRREFIKRLGAAAAWPLGARAQVSTKRPLIGVMVAVTRPGNPVLNAFVRGLRELGYVEGQNIDIAWRFAEGRMDRFPELAEGLVRLMPDVIIAAVTPAAVATKKLTQTIPIVCPLLADPIRLGLIASESRPGGNVTGLLFRLEGLTGKQIELALELIPNLAESGCW